MKVLTLRDAASEAVVIPAVEVYRGVIRRPDMFESHQLRAMFHAIKRELEGRGSYEAAFAPVDSESREADRLDTLGKELSKGGAA